MATHFERLPTSYVPKTYKITFIPNVHDNSFLGESNITITLTEPTQRFVLNSKNLEIIAASCNTENAKEISYNENLQLITINFESLFKDEVCLTLEFKGKLEERMQGFYKSSYKSETGAEKIILCTQFEPTWARKAFPCFDEPSIKASFTIYLIILDHLTALSNMPIVSRVPVDTPKGFPAPNKNRKYVKVEYCETPRMSTYLLAIVIGHFDYISARDTNGVEIRVYTPPNKTHLGEHALRMAKSALPYYCNVFGNAFPLPKLDLVAIPDFGAGAMENWGLVTYRATALLIDKDQSSLQSKRNVALTVSHELAHMWFGNLVTMAWWTHLWLNEGFATWVEYLAVDHCFPEYDIWTIFLTREFYSAMDSDQLKTSHPIEVIVKSPEEVEEIFDAVSYEKGASIIRMLNEYLGFETFCKGLQYYISKHKYENTVTEDLWSALERASGKPIEQIMSTWTKQTGFPVLNVRAGAYTSEGYSIVIEQTRFLADGSVDADNADWYVPITICEAADSRKILLKAVVPPRGISKDQLFVVNIPLSVDCDQTHPPAIRLNPGSFGFYRVQYDTCLLPSILDALGQCKLEGIDRLSLLSDHFALARAGRISTVTALNLAVTFTSEMEYTIWCELHTQLENIRALLNESSYTSTDFIFPPKTPTEENLDAYVIYLAKPVFNTLGWVAKDEESNNNTLLRPLILSLLGRIGYSEVVEEARRMFDRHYTALMDDSTSVDQKTSSLIPPDLRMCVYSTVIHHGNETDYKKLINLHEKTSMEDERVRVLHCIGLSRSSEVIKQVTDFAFSPAVRKQDCLRPLIALSTYPAGRRAVWDKLKKQIDSLPDDLGGIALMGIIIKNCLEGFCSDKYSKEIESFFAEHPIQCVRSVQQALESIAINAAILQRDRSLLVDYLEQFAQQIHC